LEDLPTIIQKNARAEITQKKYQKQIDWRRNKVRELLIRGYSQYGISNSLHISQPTISRDIHYIQSQIQKRNKHYSNELFQAYHNTLAGLNEIVKKMCTILDDPRSDQKEKLKAASLIIECSDKRFNLLKIDPQLHELQQYTDSIIKKEKQLNAKEKILEAFREGTKLPWETLELAVSKEIVF
jgi:predicted transcriptional regulator